MAYRRRNTRSYRGSYMGIFRGAATAARMAYRFRGMGSSTTTSRKSHVGQGVTGHYDKSNIYRKKRMPRRKRKQWVKFSKKVNAVLDKSLSSKTAVLNSQDLVTTVGGTQAWLSYVLYGSEGADGNGYRGNRDLKTVLQTVADTQSARFKSAILDLTMTNVGESPIELDVYHVYFNNEHYANSPLATFNNAVGSTPGLSGSTTLTTSVRGVTPFDIPVALSTARISIKKKTKFFLAIGSSMTYQIRDARNRKIMKADISFDNDDNYVKPGWTQGIICVQKTVAGYDGSDLAAGVTRKYLYSVLQDSTDESGVY